MLSGNEAVVDEDVLNRLSLNDKSSEGFVCWALSCCCFDCFALYGGGGVPGGVTSSSFSQMPDDDFCGRSNGKCELMNYFSIEFCIKAKNSYACTNHIHTHQMFLSHGNGVNAVRAMTQHVDVSTTMDYYVSDSFGVDSNRKPFFKRKNLLFITILFSFRSGCNAI